MRPLTPSAREALGRQAASICAPATRECAYRDALLTLELMDSVGFGAVAKIARDAKRIADERARYRRIVGRAA